MDISLTNRGDAAAAAWIFSGGALRYGPLCFYLVGVPILLLACYLLLAEYVAPGEAKNLLPAEAFAIRATAPLLAGGCATLAAWGVWVGSGHSWPKMRRTYGARLSNNGVRCRKYYVENWMDDEDLEGMKPYDQCLKLFLLWVSPAICGISLLLLGVCLHALGRLERMDRKAGFLIVGVVAGLWVAASLAGAGHGISTALFATAAAGSARPTCPRARRRRSSRRATR